MLRRRRSGAQGFTLVELLVVVGILAVLAALVFPGVTGSREAAVGQSDKTDRDSVSKAAQRFQGDFQTDTGYIGDTSTQITTVPANYTQATAKYGLPLGCFVPRTVGGVAPTGMLKQQVCAASAEDTFILTTSGTQYPYKSGVTSDGQDGSGGKDEVYYLDFQAKTRLRLKDGTLSLSQKQFVPHYLPEFPITVARPLGVASNSDGVNSKFTGAQDTRWLFRIKGGAKVSDGGDTETPFQVEVWKTSVDSNGAFTWSRLTTGK